MISPRAQMLGKYRLIAEIGHGGMAEVFLAVMVGPASFSKLIALKMLRSQFAEDPEGRAMFLDEARLSARLNHPNVAQTYEVGETANRLFIAMEYLEGQPYSRIIYRAKQEGAVPLPRNHAMRILSEALSGLHHAHELKDFDGTPLQLVHRDMSPHNIFVTYDGGVKVLDFGIAKALGGAATTRTGILKGKIGYMAPEQVTADEIDRRADIYSCGVILWEVLAKRRLWQGTTDLAILTKLANESVPDIRQFVPGIPEELARICMKAVARRRDDRYSTAEEFQIDLERFLDASSDRAQPRDVGKYVAETFADLRKDTRLVIEQQLARVKSVPTSEFEAVQLPTVTGSNPAVSRSPSPLSSSGSSSGAHAALPVSGTPMTATASSGGGMTKLALVVGLLAAIAVAAWFAFAKNVRTKDATAAAAPPTSTQAASAKDDDSTDPSAATATSVDITLSGDPPNAKLYLDDQLLPSNPYVLHAPKDMTEHELRAEAADYETDDEKFVQNHDKSVTVRLKPTSKSSSRPAVAWGRPQPKPDPTPKETATAAPPPPPPPPPPTQTATTPKTNPNVKPIDTSNPFAH